MDDNKDQLQAFRQPLVTAIALILGFSIGFLADWVTEVGFAILNTADLLLLIGMIISAVCLLFALFRILKMDYPKMDVVKYYNKTLGLFIIGV